MRNLTPTIDEETYRIARMAAAEQGISVSALVRNLLGGLQNRDDRAEAIQRAFRAMDRVRKFRAANRMSREELHAR